MAFAPRYKGRDVFRIHVPRSGFTYAASLEWIMAGVWTGDLYKFMDLPAASPEQPLDQARIIAAYRCENQIRAVEAWQNRPKVKGG